jgi:hypothetical protein
MHCDRIWFIVTYLADIMMSFILVLLTKYHSGDQSQRMRWAGHVARKGREEQKCIHDFGGEPWGKETTWKTQV